MKRLHFAVGLFAVLACSGLQAQTKLEANIPFEFRMGESSFEAGSYVFDYSAHMLVVREEHGNRTAAMALMLPVSREKAPKTGIVEFNRYGETYFLAAIWTPGSPDGGSLPKSAGEKEYARRSTPGKVEAIVLKSK